MCSSITTGRLARKHSGSQDSLEARRAAEAQRSSHFRTNATPFRTAAIVTFRKSGLLNESAHLEVWIILSVQHFSSTAVHAHRGLSDLIRRADPISLHAHR